MIMTVPSCIPSSLAVWPTKRTALAAALVQCAGLTEQAAAGKSFANHHSSPLAVITQSVAKKSASLCRHS